MYFWESIHLRSTGIGGVAGIVEGFVDFFLVEEFFRIVSSFRVRLSVGSLLRGA